MSNLTDATRAIDTSTMHPVETVEGNSSPPLTDPAIQLNPFLRSPMPSINSSPDSLRQFYGPSIPQFRVMPPPLSSVQSIKGDSGEAGPAGPVGPAGRAHGTVQQLTITATTGSLTDGAIGTGTVHLGYEFTIFAVKVTTACRVRLYSSSAAATADASRTIYVGPPVASSHGVLFDLVVDGTMGSFPFTWLCSPEASGFDGETFPTGDIQYAITNLSGVTATISASFSIYQES